MAEIRYTHGRTTRAYFNPRRTHTRSQARLYPHRVQPITVWWFVRATGRIAERRQVTLTIEEATALDIWAPQPITPSRLSRLIRMRESP